MSLVSRISDLATRVGQEIKTVWSSVGTLSSLTTTAKTDLVSAINETDSSAGSAQAAADAAQSTADSKLATADTTGNALILPYGSVGGYQDGYGNTGDWGASIWSMGRGFKGAIAGANKSMAGQYGLVWLRTDHPSAVSGEGLYVLRNGTIDAALAVFSSQISGAVNFRNTTTPWIRGYTSAQALTIAGNTAAANSSLIQLFGSGNASGGDEVRVFSGAKVRIRLRGNGRLAIGDDAMAVPDDANYQLKLTGKAWASLGWETVSDSREKKDLEDITGALEKLQQLSGKKYKLKGAEKRQAGLIAEEWEAVLPEAVSEVEVGEEIKEGETYDRVETVTEIIDSEEITDPETGEKTVKEITRQKQIGVYKRKALDLMAPHALFVAALKELHAEVEQLKAEARNGGKGPA